MTPSPCTSVCTIDAGTGWCRGCGRTTDEIAGWFYATDREKRAILSTLPTRLRLLKQGHG
jgi:predicted Fe-S protein YdhL (DUF1289 family)